MKRFWALPPASVRPAAVAALPASPAAVPGPGPQFPALPSYVSVQSRGGHRHLQIGRCMYVCMYPKCGNLGGQKGQEAVNS